METHILLTMTHRRLTGGAPRFAPGWHAYLDRLAAHLGGEKLPDWQQSGTTPPRRPISHGSNEKEKVMCTL